MKKSYKHLIRFIKEFIKEGGTDTLHAFQLQEFIGRIHPYYDKTYVECILDYSCEKSKRDGKTYARNIPKQREK